MNELIDGFHPSGLGPFMPPKKLLQRERLRQATKQGVKSRFSWLTGKTEQLYSVSKSSCQI